MHGGVGDARPERRPPVDARLVAERVLEDEALRGSLTDAAYAPLLEVTLAICLRRAWRFASTDDLADAVRAFLRSAVHAAEADEPPSLDTPPGRRLFSADEARRVRDLRLGGGADARARQIADGVALACGLANG